MRKQTKLVAVLSAAALQQAFHGTSFAGQKDPT